MKLKVCGMRDSSNIMSVSKLKPDYMGFIFYKKSKRFAGNILEENVLRGLPASIKRVGVFVNEKVEIILDKAKKFNFYAIQLHGDERPEDCKILKEHNCTVIKAFPLDENFDFNILIPYKKYCDYFLFDTKTELYGGSGKSFNWDILKKYDNEIPFFLSGGVDSEHIESIKALKGLNIHAIDINSRFETEPGLKNILKIKEFKNKLI